jgi:hypothetical protein
LLCSTSLAASTCRKPCSSQLSLAVLPNTPRHRGHQNLLLEAHVAFGAKLSNSAVRSSPQERNSEAEIWRGHTAASSGLRWLWSGIQVGIYMNRKQTVGAGIIKIRLLAPKSRLSHLISSEASDPTYHGSIHHPICVCRTAVCTRYSQRLNLLSNRLRNSSDEQEAGERTNVYLRTHTYIQTESHDCHH